MIHQQNDNPILYGVGLLSMVLSISLFFFSLYITPYVLLGMEYAVPEFIVLVYYWYSIVQGYSGIILLFINILPYLLSSLILGFVAKRLTNKVETKNNNLLTQTESLSILLKPALMELVFIAIVLLNLFFAIYLIVIEFE